MAEIDVVRARYARAHALSRLARFACLVAAGMFFAWALPFFPFGPFGLDIGDYTGSTTMLLALAAMAVNLAILSMFYFTRATRHRDMWLAWSAVFEEESSLRNREYFLERLDLEIASANVSNRSFRVFLLQARRQTADGRFVNASRNELAELARSIREGLGGRATLGSVRPTELAVLTSGVRPAIIDTDEEQILTAIRRFISNRARVKCWKIQLGGTAFDGTEGDPITVLDRTRIGLIASPHIFLTPEDEQGEHKLQAG